MVVVVVPKAAFAPAAQYTDLSSDTDWALYPAGPTCIVLAV